MRYFPMFLDMADTTVLLAGGGEQVAQKARLLKRTDANLIIMSETLVPELAALLANGRVSHRQSAFDPDAIAAARFVFIATGNDALDDKVAAEASRLGKLVNMVDRPDRCDMITPALVDRDPVVVAIGTEGAAPVLAKAIKTSLEQALSPKIGPFISMIRDQREPVANLVSSTDRLKFWNWAIKGAPWRKWQSGKEEEAQSMIAAAAQSGGAPDAEADGISMVEIPAAPDLAPLRAVQRLQEATTIFHPENLDDAVLELARRDAVRVALPQCPRHGPGTAEIIAAASEGPVVVLVQPACSPTGLDIEEHQDVERIGAAHS